MSNPAVSTVIIILLILLVFVIGMLVLEVSVSRRRKQLPPSDKISTSLIQIEGQPSIGVYITAGQARHYQWALLRAVKALDNTIKLKEDREGYDPSEEEDSQDHTSRAAIVSLYNLLHRANAPESDTVFVSRAPSYELTPEQKKRIVRVASFAASVAVIAVLLAVFLYVMMLYAEAVSNYT